MSKESKPLIAITGASSGIGAATAKIFSDAGFPLLLIARRVQPMVELDLHSEVVCAEVDVTDRSSLLRAVAQAEEQFGPVDGLINNAGVMYTDSPVTQDVEQWDQMIDVNVKGLLNGIHSVLPGMVERRGGTIINIGSIAGRKTFPNHAVYCGTKFAVHAISENIREEVSGHNVRVITIAPGMVDTELVMSSTNEESKQGWLDYAESIGGALRPEDIADAILYAYQAPQSVCVREMVVCPTRQEP